VTGLSSQGVLEGVFRELIRRQVPLGTRDYLDSLRALQLGFGGQSREHLRMLCHRLWARSDIERRAIDVAFALVAEPAADDAEARELEAALQGPTARQRPGPATRRTEPSASPDHKPAGGTPSTYDPRAGAAFVPAADPDAIPLPPAGIEPLGRETYVLQPQTVVSERDLTVMWRRMRSFTRRGPGRELDIEKTIRERCRCGVLPQAVLRPSRRNTAGLLVFADTSPSMAPWRPFLSVLADSLALGRLRAQQVFYFSNLPRNWLFHEPTLDERINLDEIARRYAGLPLLIVSDGGAARGHFSPQRVRQTMAFVERITGHFQPIVWLNPMPRPRWNGTSAAILVDESRISVVPLDKEALIRAMDLLRGERRA
jgi:uncharacterized protein